MRTISNKLIINKHAFTVVELMITCLIIGVLVSLAVPAYMTSRLRAEEQKGITGLYAFAQAQKAFWFDRRGIPPDDYTYTGVMSDLTPSFVDMPDDDGDWIYTIDNFTTDTFTILAQHQDRFGAIGDGITLQINEQGHITRTGFPYTILEAP